MSIIDPYESGLWFIEPDQVAGYSGPNRDKISGIQHAYCKAYGITLAQLKSQSKKRRFAYPRMMAMAHCVDETTYSLTNIAWAFGRSDHTTVIHAHRKFGVKQHDKA